MAAWVAVPGIVLVFAGLVALAWYDGRQLGPMGRTTYVIAILLAFPLAVIATALVLETLVDAASPTGAATVFFAATFPAVLLLAGLFLVSRHTWSGRGWWLLALPPAILVVAALVPTTGAGASVALPLGALGLMATAAVAPPAAARLLDRDEPVRQAMGALLAGALLFMAAPNLLAVPVFLTEGAQQAEHTWEVRYVPDANTTTADYTMRIPYLVAQEPETQTILDRLTRDLQVTDGIVSFRLAENGTMVDVFGQGAFTISATATFYGAPEHREAFAYAPAQPALVRIQADREAVSGDLSVHLDLSGGSGHTCWKEGTDTTHIQAGPVEDKFWPAPDPYAAETACA